MQISFCENCGVRISSREIAQGKAVRLGESFYCGDCRDQAPTEGQAPLLLVEGQTPAEEGQSPPPVSPPVQMPGEIEIPTLENIGTPPQLSPTQAPAPTPGPGASQPPKGPLSIHDELMSQIKNVPDPQPQAMQEPAGAVDLSFPAEEVTCPYCQAQLWAPDGVPVFRCSMCQEVIEREGADQVAIEEEEEEATSDQDTFRQETPFQSETMSMPNEEDLPIKPPVRAQPTSELIRRQQSRESMIARVKALKNEKSNKLGAEKKTMLIGAGVAGAFFLAAMFVPDLKEPIAWINTQIAETIGQWFGP